MVPCCKRSCWQLIAVIRVCATCEECRPGRVWSVSVTLDGSSAFPSAAAISKSNKLPCCLFQELWLNDVVSTCVCCTLLAQVIQCCKRCEIAIRLFAGLLTSWIRWTKPLRLDHQRFSGSLAWGKGPRWQTSRERWQPKKRQHSDLKPDFFFLATCQSSSKNARIPRLAYVVYLT